jgi:hypothetical protein
MIEVSTPQPGEPTKRNAAATRQGNESLLSPVEHFRSQVRQRYHIPGQPSAPRD